MMAELLSRLQPNDLYCRPLLNQLPVSIPGSKAVLKPITPSCPPLWQRPSAVLPQRLFSRGRRLTFSVSSSFSA